MNRDDRFQLQATMDEIAGWAAQAEMILSARERIEAAASGALSGLRRGMVDVGRDGRTAWRVLAVPCGSGPALNDLERASLLPIMSSADADDVRQLRAQVPQALRDAGALLGLRRLVSGRARRARAASAAEFLAAYQAWGRMTDLTGTLERLRPQPYAPSSDLKGLISHLATTPPLSRSGRRPTVLSGLTLIDLPGAVETVQGALRDEKRLGAAAHEAGDAARRAEADRLVAEMPVDRLKEVTREALRIGALEDAGLTTVRRVLDAGPRITGLPGVGEVTAARMVGAARTLWQTTFDETPVRIDLHRRGPECTELLRRLALWEAARSITNAPDDLARAEELTRLSQVAANPTESVVVYPTSDLGADELRADIRAVVRLARQVARASAPTRQRDPWEDFLARPADYFGLLAELGFNTEDEQKVHGDLPAEIVEAIRALTLETTHLKVGTLRGYQSFGARFALVQRKVIIGDEMGLGKTIEALAVLAHLRSRGEQRFVVICPAAVVTNWIREIGSKTDLIPHRLHGDERAVAASSWLRTGGVGVTTFETLPWFKSHLQEAGDLDCVVIDEAHYIKNPATKRAQRCADVLARSERALLLTGTPLENRADEFAALVGYVRPELAADADSLSARRFRKRVAPVYLRRNQEDVLTELPELVEVDEWLPLSPDDMIAYRSAVGEGNFMAMRQAAMLQGRRSEKILRLIEVVHEAGENGRRVIVFSNFRAVLGQVARLLPGQVFGPITGSVPANARQDIVDQFSQAGAGAVLVAQIIAGGVGLNIQAASVVVICEPQLKPTTEWQAIARARRMGQLEAVQVHRLLSEQCVDERVTEILARKTSLFDDFARVSEVADSAPEAFDISEAQLAREVVAAERERLFSRPQQGVGA
ncbi:DEAD/DEAH box helicase [Brooklawnia cerclae]|uniref:Helicase SNF2 n=1 Tax=Brooklawnia cerclae TaxID=349934 RepID=A0ABX0SFQ6_9ACTN|nr:DEAD/DEAH box helicase [Brooklawnia cerclae]NIH56729.1 hypothetical protein [Brooklawnia cerclae]